MTLKLDNGRVYIGEVDVDMFPNGRGAESYPNGKVLYKGQFKHGLKDGLGIFYYESGIEGYNGQFKDNFIDGDGLLFYQTSGNLLFEGTFSKGNYVKGAFYFENGTVSEIV